MHRKYSQIVKLSMHVLRKDVLQGHLSWKVTELSRTAKVPRSRIYELLGRDKKSMLLNALKTTLEEIYGLSAERLEFNKTHSHMEAILLSRQFVVDMPELFVFYFRHRSREDEVGAMIREYELKYTQFLGARTGIVDPEKLMLARIFIHGISTASFLTDEQVFVSLKSIMKQIS